MLPTLLFHWYYCFFLAVPSHIHKPVCKYVYMDVDTHVHIYIHSHTNYILELCCPIVATEAVYQTEVADTRMPWDVLSLKKKHGD